MAFRAEANAVPIPGYKLLDRLGGGGFGEVWRAEAPGGIMKAIKFVHGEASSTSDGDQRARQELKSMERIKNIRHPYLLTLERYDVVEGTLMIIMELADRNLWDRYKECRASGKPGIPREELLRYMDEAAEALDFMNREHNLQHLDIKPQNLFLIQNHIKVADFGLVKDMDGSQASVTGGLTPVYAPPETFDNRVTRFSDQYSLAIVFQELLTGQRPFSGTNPRQLVMQHISQPPNVSPLPAGDQPHIARALAKEPNERFPACRDLVMALRTTIPTASNNGTLLNPLAASPSAQGAMTPQVTPQVPAPVPPSWPGSTSAPSSVPATANLRMPGADVAAAQGIKPGSKHGQQPGSAHGVKTTRADQPVLQPQDQATIVPPRELLGSGSLFPTLFVGLGQTGLLMLQRLREQLSIVAPLAHLSSVRFLLIDTDPEVIRTASRGLSGSALTPNEILVTELNRPTHYLKPKDGRPSIESWLLPKIIYRIPRSMVTTGVRGLGRLALIDNYRMILRRLQNELDACLDEENLRQSAERTKLGLRTNRPRAYVLTSLWGGTGSGMFIDIAYNLRALIRQYGYEEPDVVGLLALPPIEGGRTRTMALGNTCAALKELDYFGMPHTSFVARYHDREAGLLDQGPPFSRMVLVPMPDETDEQASNEAIDLVAQYLYRDVATPFGRAVDADRAGLAASPWESRGRYFATFNLNQMSWPRHPLLMIVARHLCQRIISRWLSKDSKPIRSAMQDWVQIQWREKELNPDIFIKRVQEEIRRNFGRDPDDVFVSLLQIVGPGSSQGVSKAEAVRNKNQPPKGLEPEKVSEVVEKFNELLGRPSEDYPHDAPPQLIGIVRQCCNSLIEEWSATLEQLSVQLIEEPAYRLAGAEESLRQFIATIEQSLQSHESVLRDLTDRAARSFEVVLAISSLNKTGSRKTGMTSQEAINLLREYPRWRYQSLLLDFVIKSFVGLRGQLSDLMREVNFCRNRLGDMQRYFEDVPQYEKTLLREAATPQKKGPSKRLFMAGCKDLQAAVNEYLAAMTPDHLLELDIRMEEMLKSQFEALVHVCMTTDNIQRNVQAAMLQVARDFTAEHLPGTSVADLYFENTNEAEMAQELSVFYEEATPKLEVSRAGRGGPPSGEVRVLTTPNDEAGEKFRWLLQQTVAQSLEKAASQDDITIYRERINLPLTGLDHMGAAGIEAYNQMRSTDDLSPHSRCDVDFSEG